MSFQDISLENGHVGVGPGICSNQVVNEFLGLQGFVLINLLHGLALKLTKLHHQPALGPHVQSLLTHKKAA